MQSSELDRLVELAGELNDEAAACAAAKQWRAATLLVAESVEAGLVATISRLEDDLRAHGFWPSRKDAPEDWPLDTLLVVASHAGWLPTTLPTSTMPLDALDGDVGDAVRFLKEVRNLAAHPARAISGGRLAGHDFADSDLMSQVYRLLEGISGAVFDRLGMALRGPN